MYSPRLFFKDIYVAIPAAVCLGLQITMWLYLSIALKPSGEQYFLHYTSVFGVDLVGERSQLFYLPTLGILIFFINYGLSLVVFRRDRFLARVLSIMSAMCQLGLLLATHLLVSINS